MSLGRLEMGSIGIFCIAVLLSGLVGAGLIPYFGIAQDSVEVKGPVLYLGESISRGSGVFPNSFYGNLSVNLVPVNESIVGFSSYSSAVFYSDPWEVDEVYPTVFDFYVWAKTNDLDGGYMGFRIVKTNGVEKTYEVCDSGFYEVGRDGFGLVRGSCVLDESLEIENGESLAVLVYGYEGSYLISTGKEYSEGFSRVEMLDYNGGGEGRGLSLSELQSRFGEGGDGGAEVRNADVVSVESGASEWVVSQPKR